MRSTHDCLSEVSSGRCPSPVCGFPAIWVVCRGVRCGLRLVTGEGVGAGAGRRRMPRNRWRPALRGPPSSTSASTSCLSRHVIPRRLWRVVGWLGILLDVIGGVESALWEGCYPALTLAPTCGANRASGVYQRWFSSTLHTGWGTVWQPSLSSGVSDAPWLNLRLPGSLYSVIGHE